MTKISKELSSSSPKLTAKHKKHSAKNTALIQCH